MKHNALLASLCANALLLGLTVFDGCTHGGVAGTFLVRAVCKNPGLTNPRAESPCRNIAGSGDSLLPLNWETIESADYREYISNLRRVRCPEETIADIVVADVRKVFSRERRNICGEFTGASVNGAAGTEARLAELKAQENKVLDELLGAGWHSTQPEVLDQYGGRLQGLSRDLANKVLDIERDYHARVEAIEASSPGGLLPEDRAELRRCQREKDLQLAATLGAEAYENYLINSSTSVQALRSNHLFSFTDEAEFRAVAKAQVEYSRQMDDLEASPSPAEAQAVAEQGFQKAVAEVLGPERHAQFERTRDDRYRQLASLASRYQLPAGTADEVFALRFGSTPQAAPGQGNAASGEVDQKIQGLLGEQAFASYLGLGLQ